MTVKEIALQSTRFLNRLITLLTALLLVYASLFSWQSWRDEKASKLQDIENLLDLEVKAIDSYFTRIEDDLRGLGQELIDVTGITSPPADPAFFDTAFVLIRRFTKLHSGLFNVNLLREDGQILLSGKMPYSPTLPTVANEPTWIRFREEPRPDRHMTIGRATKTFFYDEWIIPFRFEVKNSGGNTLFILSDNIPIDLLQNFWKDAPFTRKASLGLVRDDGFQVSRYPFPAKIELKDVYGKPGSGALVTYLKQKQFPDRGYTEGPSSLDGINYLHAFKRLEHFPITLFIDVPLSDIRAGWLNRIKVPYILLLILFAGGIIVYNRTYHQQMVWEIKLNDSKVFLENIIEQSPIPKVIFDHSGMFIRTNQAFRERFSINDEELIGRYSLLNDNQFAEQGVMPQVEEVFNKGTSTRFVIDYDTSLIHNMKPVYTKRLILDVTVSAVINSDGKVIYVVAQHIDITEQKYQEKMLIQQSRMAAMGEMINNIAHQWKQPLNALNLLFFNIKDAYHYNELDEACIDKTVADGEYLVQKMSTTITDFRNFFRPDKEIKAFSVTDQIRQAIMLIQADFHKYGISIHTDAPQDLMISGIPNEFSHVLLNLFSNARDAILKHQPSAADRVDVTVREQDGQGCVLIRDTGGGIPDNILGRIFDPYYTTKEEGSGIGLYMSKMIIEDHMNGSLTAKNIEGGAEFCISIPMAKQKAQYLR